MSDSGEKKLRDNGALLPSDAGYESGTGPFNAIPRSLGKFYVKFYVKYDKEHMGRKDWWTCKGCGRLVAQPGLAGHLNLCKSQEVDCDF